MPAALSLTALRLSVAARAAPTGDKCWRISAVSRLIIEPAVTLARRWAPRVCAAYLLWLAWQLAKAPGDHGQAARESAPASLPAGPGGAFVQGIAIQSLNPKAWLVALSGIGMFVAPLAAQQVSLPTALLLFCAVSLLACLLGVGCWAALGHALTRWLSTPLRQRRLNQALAMVLVASVVSMLA